MIRGGIVTCLKCGNKSTLMLNGRTLYGTNKSPLTLEVYSSDEWITERKRQWSISLALDYWVRLLEEKWDELLRLSKCRKTWDNLINEGLTFFWSFYHKLSFLTLLSLKWFYLSTLPFCRFMTILLFYSPPWAMALQDGLEARVLTVKSWPCKQTLNRPPLLHLCQHLLVFLSLPPSLAQFFFHLVPHVLSPSLSIKSLRSFFFCSMWLQMTLTLEIWNHYLSTMLCCFHFTGGLQQVH